MNRLLETWGRTTNLYLPMDKKNRLRYEPPKVTAVAFKVEDGLQASPVVPLSGVMLDAFGNDSWNDATTSSSTSHFGNGEWTGGSSFSNNSSFGNDTWNN